jgi:endonuclease-3
MNFDVDQAMRTVRKEVRKWRDPSVTQVAKKTRDPFRVLISCLLSLRTKDEVTAEASARLFALASTPGEMVKLPARTIAKTIFPVGFYNKKAKTIRVVCRDLIARFGSRVPDELDDLLTLKGVGRKTANLVLTKGFGKPGICVDTHVHRIVNRWGYVKTKTPDKTELALRDKLPKRYWITINDLLVTFGKNMCKPISPHCSQCPLPKMCPQIGVTRHR